MANAQAGRNLDILELARLTVPIRINQGGHGSTDAKQGLTNLIVNANGVPFKDTNYTGTLKQDTLTANRTWTLPDATGTIALTSDVNAVGRVLQVVNSNISTEVDCTTKMVTTAAPTNSDGDEVLTCAITPVSDKSKLLVRATIGSILFVTATVAGQALFRDSTAAALISGYVVANTPSVLEVLVNSTATTETTFKLRVGPTTTGTAKLNGAMGGTMAVSLTITEIAA